MRDVRNPDALWISIITSLTVILCLPAWLSAQARAYLIPRVLSHMDNHRSITLPSFDLLHLDYVISSSGTHVSPGRPRFSSSRGSIGQTNVVSIRVLARQRWRRGTAYANSRHTYLYSPYLRAHHVKPIIPIPQASTIAAPAYSNADSRHVHSYYRHPAPQSYDPPRPSTSCHPPRAILTTYRRVYNYFYACLCWVSTYDHPRVPSSLLKNQGI